MAARLKKTVVGLSRPEGPPVLKNKLVNREAPVFPSSQDPDGLRFTLRGSPDGLPHVALEDAHLPGLGEVKISPPGVTVVERELDLASYPVPSSQVLARVEEVGACDVADNDGPLEDSLETRNILKGGARFVDSGLPLGDLLAPCRGKTLAALCAFKVLDDPPGDAVKVSSSHRIEILPVGLTDWVEAVDNNADRVGVGVVQSVDPLQGAGLCFWGNLKDVATPGSALVQGSKAVLVDPLTRGLLA